MKTSTWIVKSGKKLLRLTITLVCFAAVLTGRAQSTTVVAWGAGTNCPGDNNKYGQSVVPVGLSNVVAIAAGAYHSLVLKADGGVVAWGAITNDYGQVVHQPPNYGQSIIPVDLSNVVAIAGGF